MSFDLKTIVLYLVCIAGFLLMLKLFKKPLKWLLKLVVSCIISGLALFVLNMIIAKTGFHIPINPFNALVASVLGIPGVVLLGLITVVL